MAKELYIPPSGGSPEYNEMTDIWAFGMVIYVSVIISNDIIR